MFVGAVRFKFALGLHEVRHVEAGEDSQRKLAQQHCDVGEDREEPNPCDRFDAAQRQLASPADNR